MLRAARPTAARIDSLSDSFRAPFRSPARLASLPTLVLLLALGTFAREPAPPASDAARLVRLLGSDDFNEREEAMRRLDQLGADALDAVRAGLKSDDPEVVRRCQELLRQIERRLGNERTLTPTLVELEARDQPLDSVLEVLSRQVRWPVVLGGNRPEEWAQRRVTVATGGKVPFWEAVLKVCEAADLRVAVANGVLAPGATPYLGRPRPGVRTAPPHAALVLEPRGESRRRPAAVHGAVLIEAVPFPRDTPPGLASVLLQVWPEPRLRWEETTTARVVKAVEPDGSLLAADYLPADSSDVRRTADGLVLVRNADGSVTLLRETGDAFLSPAAFRPHPWQAVVRFKSAREPPAVARELSAVVVGIARTGMEPLCRVTDLKPNQTVTASGPGGTELRFTYSPSSDTAWTARAEISYVATDVRLAGVNDDLPGVRVGEFGGNSTASGLLLTDADGRPFVLGLLTGASSGDPTGKRIGVILNLSFEPGRRVPQAVTLWGSYRKPVEVAARLRDVPLTGGK